MTWPQAYALCIWDGGFLPSEAEWVGSAPAGAGAWGQVDLAGNVWEFVLDGDCNPWVDPCVDCVSPAAFSTGPWRALYDVGIRCARSP